MFMMLFDKNPVDRKYNFIESSTKYSTYFVKNEVLLTVLRRILCIFCNDGDIQNILKDTSNFFNIPQ